MSSFIPEIVNADITTQDSPAIDAFGRWRVSNPQTIFDSKQIYDAEPLLWDDAATSGAGTGSSHSADTASTTISVSASTAGVRVRQTFMRFNYQPGKGQLIMMTGVLDKTGGGTGITRRLGYFDSNNGLFFEDAAGTYKVGVRTHTSGSAVDTTVAQTSWNLDKMNGSGSSGITLDFTKTQIFVIDFEWLGVGRVRFGFVVNGLIYYCHQVLNANVLDKVYISDPNLPLRYEITNDGTGVASTLECICGTVQSEGGQAATAKVRAVSTSGTHVDANSIGTLYAVVGLRLNSSYLSASVEEVLIAMFSKTADNFEWSLWFNPTVAGTFNYSQVTSSAVDAALGATANTVTGGTLIQCGFSTSSNAALAPALGRRRLGVAINGTRDTVVLCVRPFSTNADIEGAMTWREYR